MSEHYLKFASEADFKAVTSYLRGCSLGADPDRGLLEACSAFVRSEGVTAELDGDEIVPLLRALAAWMGEDVGRDLLPAEERLIAAFAALPEQLIEVAYSKPPKANGGAL